MSPSYGAPAALCRSRPWKHHLPNHRKRYHYFQFAHEKLRPRDCRSLAQGHTAGRCLSHARPSGPVPPWKGCWWGSPFLLNKHPWSESHRRLFKAAKSDVNQGESRARQAVLTAGLPRGVCQAQARSGIWCWHTAWCGELSGDANSSWKTSVGLLEPKEAPCPLQPPQYLDKSQGGRLAGRVGSGTGVSWDLVL